MDGRTDGRTNGRTDGRTDGWTDGRKEGRAAFKLKTIGISGDKQIFYAIDGILLI